MPSFLSAAEHRSYADAGFVVLSKKFSESELAGMRAACDELLAQPGCAAVPGNPRVQIEPETIDWACPIIRKVEPVVDISPALQALVRDDRMTSAAADALGVDDVILFEDKLNYKPPKIGSSYPLHQDR